MRSALMAATDIDGLDLSELAEELDRLRASMRLQAETANSEHEEAIDSIAKAEGGARAGSYAETWAGLRLAGQWALDVAKKSGVPIAVEALERAVA